MGLKLYLTPEKDLENKTIEDVFDDEVLDSNFWLYWRTMFAFENWHSALEMKRYMQRFVHHSVSTVADSQLVFSTSPQNFSGWPKSSDCFRELALGAGDETLHAAVRAPHRRFA